jgi:hypothetical protein
MLGLAPWIARSTVTFGAIGIDIDLAMGLSRSPRTQQAAVTGARTVRCVPW